VGISDRGVSPVGLVYSTAILRTRARARLRRVPLIRFMNIAAQASPGRRGVSPVGTRAADGDDASISTGRGPYAGRGTGEGSAQAKGTEEDRVLIGVATDATSNPRGKGAG
jgi:hypothetical protein